MFNCKDTTDFRYFHILCNIFFLKMCEYNFSASKVIVYPT